jgi:hypothetical protein
MSVILVFDSRGRLWPLLQDPMCSRLRSLPVDALAEAVAAFVGSSAAGPVGESGEAFVLMAVDNHLGDHPFQRIAMGISSVRSCTAADSRHTRRTP